MCCRVTQQYMSFLMSDFNIVCNVVYSSLHVYVLCVVQWVFVLIYRVPLRTVHTARACDM